MSIFIIEEFLTEDGFQTRETVYHIGQKLPIIKESLIIEIQASDDELNHIIENIVNIPYHKTQRVQKWYGDMAKFIYNGLKYPTILRKNNNEGRTR